MAKAKVKVKTVKKKISKTKKKTVKSKSKLLKSKKMSEEKKTTDPQIEVNLKPFYKESYTLSSTNNPNDPNPIPGWMFDKAIRVCKLKYANYLAFEKDYLESQGEHLGTKEEDPLMRPMLDWLKDNWSKDKAELPDGTKIDMRPYEVKDIFKLEYQEHKRMLYQIFGIERIFKEFNFKLIGTETVKKKRHRWNEKNDPSIRDNAKTEEKYEPWLHEFDDTYELYELPIVDMFPELKGQRRADEKIFCVRMVCTSTGKEHMIYVPREAAEKKDPVSAIAWTIQPNITNPERIYRQGDIVIAKHSKDSKKQTPTPLTRTQYLELMYSET